MPCAHNTKKMVGDGKLLEYQNIKIILMDNHEGSLARQWSSELRNNQCEVLPTMVLALPILELSVCLLISERCPFTQLEAQPIQTYFVTSSWIAHSIQNLFYEGVGSLPYKR